MAESYFCVPPKLAQIEIGTCYQPAIRPDLVGGDFFDFIQFTPHRLGVVIGDACGKGLAAAALTGVCRYVLRAYALEDSTPARVVQRVNRALCNYVSEKCAFLTLIYGVLDLRSFQFTYASAGHPPPLLCNPLSGGSVELDGTGGLLGWDPSWAWCERQVLIPPGGAIALFTDGVTEAHNGKKMLGTAPVQAALHNCLEQGAPDIAANILQQAVSFAGGNLTDDVAIVVLRRPPSARSPKS